MQIATSGRVRLNCAQCSKEFETYRSHANRRPFLTCSLSCARSYFPSKKRIRVYLACENCGCQFDVPVGRSTGEKRPKARFCSKECKDGFQKGNNHPAYIDGRAEARAQCRKVIAKRIFEEGRCEECGSTAFLHGHHIKPFSTHPELRDEPSNIQVLCRECHANKHPHQARKLFKGVARSGITKACPICSTEFYVKRSHIALRTTCSRGCAGVLRRSRAG